MTSEPLKELFQKLIDGKMTVSEFNDLKADLLIKSDEVISDDLEAIWATYQPQSMLSKEDEFEILHNLTNNSQRANHRRSHRIKYWLKKISQVPAIAAICTYFLSATSDEASSFTVYTLPGQKTQIILPDCTLVWLNSDSKLIYQSDFGVNERRVMLEGEAFFDVSEEKEKRFVVETNRLNTVVHGTSFNVSAYKSDSVIQVSLQTGKISLHTSDNVLLTYLSPNQQAIISKNDLKFQTIACDSEIESLWRNNMLKFVDANLSDTYKKLERWYGVNIHIENSDASYRYGFTIKNESLIEMLALINKITPIEYHINGEEVIIRYLD